MRPLSRQEIAGAQIVFDSQKTDECFDCHCIDNLVNEKCYDCWAQNNDVHEASAEPKGDRMNSKIVLVVTVD